VALVDQVAHRLAEQVVADRVAGEAVLLQHLPFAFAVAAVFEGLADLEVIPPARQFDTVVAELLRFLAYDIELQIRPLTGEQRDGSCHLRPSFREHRPIPGAKHWRTSRSTWLAINRQWHPPNPHSDRAAQVIRKNLAPLAEVEIPCRRPIQAGNVTMGRTGLAIRPSRPSAGGGIRPGVTAGGPGRRRLVPSQQRQSPPAQLTEQWHTTEKTRP